MKRFRGYLYIIAGTVFWGLSGVIAKMIFTPVDSASTSIEPLILVQTRVSFSFAAMLAFFLVFNPKVLRVRLRDLHRFVLLGVCGVAGSNITYYVAIQEINVSAAILMQYTAPLLVLIYAAATKEESLSVVKALAALLSILGCFFAVGGTDMSLVHISKLGLIAGAGAALTWAFTNIYLRHLLRDYSVWTVLLYSFLTASVFWLFINPPGTIFAADYSSEQWLVFLGFAMISVLIPHSLYFMGVRHIVASRAIITATFEPIVAITCSFLILGELLTPVQIAGALVVIGAITLLQIKREETDTLSPAVEPETSR